ncbi:MAG: hypothetical protein H7A40_01845 [Chlamydiales bacterium]|nr:hypothetical protein [Chlamydiales bacterium]
MPEIAHIAAGIIATVATLGLSDKVLAYRSMHMYEASKGFINICYIMPLKIMNTNAKVLFSKAIVIPWLDDKARRSLINARNSESEHCHFQAIAHSISNLVLTIPQAFIHLGLAVPFVALSFLTMGTHDSINATAYVSIEQITNTPNVILQDLTRIVTCALKGTYSLASKVAEAPFRVASRLW